MLRRPLPWGVVVSLGLLVGLALGGSIESTTCLKRSMGYDSFVCVCNERQCHYLPPLEVAPSGNARVYISSREALRLDRDEVAFSPPDYQTKAQTLTVNRAEKYQTVHGFGGAFTDATGYNIQSLPQPTQDLLLRSYYSEDGLEYNLGRVPIGGTDFSDREYTYDDSPTEDVKLTSFSLQPDDYSYKINYILRAKSMMPPSSGELLLFSSIWSPPKWMKTSGKYSGFGFLKKEHYQTYADYFVRFLEAYEANNVTFYSVSTGNEPLNGVIPFKNFNSLGWWPQNMHIWIRDHFGPTIRKSKFKDIKILAFDDQRIMLPWMLERVLADKTTTDFIDLIGYHWYLNFLTPGSILDAVHKNWPDKPIINTEACNGDKPWDFIRVMPGDWSRGEYYIQDIINVMHHWTSGWIDWNLALNMQGGPTWAKNWVDSPIIVDSSRGEFYLNPTFYALAHFSKFVPRGSVRLGLSSEGGPLLGGKVAHIAFQRPDNGTTIVMLNKSDKSRDIVIREHLGDLKITMPAKSFATVVYW